jgi:hypothetical protein
MNAKPFLRAALLSLSLGALLGGAVSASDETSIRILTDGQAEVLVLRDLDASLPLGETREFRTESGKLAIVGRSEQGLIIDIDGEQTEVALGAPGALPGGQGERKLKIRVEGDGGQAGEGRVVRIEKRIAASAEGEEESEAKARVIVLRQHGEEGEVDAAIAEALIAVGLDEATRERVAFAIASGEGETSGKQVIVTRRVQRAD